MAAAGALSAPEITLDQAVLLITISGRIFVFATEIKALQCQPGGTARWLNEVKVADYLNRGDRPSPSPSTFKTYRDSSRSYLTVSH